MRITLSLSDSQMLLLKKLMDADNQTNRSAYIVYLISQEQKNRNKRPVGRPRKGELDEENDDPEDYTNDLPKNIPHYGEMIGPREYADKEEIRKGFQPLG